MLNLIAFMAMLTVLLSYAYMTKTGNQKQFNYVNVVTSLPLFFTGLMIGAYAHAVLSLFFGIVGAYAVFKNN